MKFRNMIFVLAIAFSIIFALMMGTSYAYYVVTEGTKIEVTTGSIDTGVAIVFEQSQYINISSGIPISEDNIDKYASKSVFTLTPNGVFLANADVAVNISIVDVTVDTKLRVADFKYDLSCVDSDGAATKFSGNGTDFSGDFVSTNSLKLGTLSTSDGTFDVKKNYTCTFRVWLQETGEDQNDLMGRSFSGLIKVNTLFRK